MPLLYLFIAALLLLLILIFLVWLIITLIFALTMLRGAVYVPSRPDKIATILQLALHLKPQRIAELGSGDGRLAVALSQTGALTHGYEINPLLVWQSRRLINQHHLSHQIQIFTKDYWPIDLSGYDLIVVYGTSYIMSRLKTKFLQELKPGSHIISNYFQLPNWKPLKTQNEIHLYKISQTPAASR